MDVMEAMVDKGGAKIDYSTVLTALRAKRGDVLQLLLLQRGLRREDRMTDENVELLRVEAEDAKPVPLKELVEELISTRPSPSQRT